MKQRAAALAAAVIASSGLIVLGSVNDGLPGTLALLAGAMPCVAWAMLAGPMRPSHRVPQRASRVAVGTLVMPSRAVYLLPLARRPGDPTSHRLRRRPHPRQAPEEAPRGTR